MKNKSGIFSGKNLLGIIIFVIILVLINLLPIDNYYRKIINLSFIYIVLALSLNLINGFTGLFSLGHYGFMALGAYTTAILQMPVQAKEAYYNIQPIYDGLKNLQLPLIPALIVSGLIAAVLGFLIALPVLRLNDDYLAIASMGFAEIILVFIRTQFRITNGALGLKGIPRIDSFYLYGGIALVMIIFMIVLTNSSKGKSLVAIREDEVAARSVGINSYRYKIISFTIASFWAGVGGGLMAVMVGTVNQMQFTFQLTFNILLIVVLGGMGKIWGTVVAAVVVTSALEIMRFLDEPMGSGMFAKGLPGLRMVVFSLLLMVTVIGRTKLKYRPKNRRNKNA